MRNKGLLLCAFLLFAIPAYSQTTVSGKVVDVIDGKTIVIQLTTGNFTAVLQYIEIPEPEQPLNQTVKDHLKTLVLGKNVEFRTVGIAPGKAFGQAYLSGVDVGEQMIRDGAAWHIPAGKTGQGEENSAAYENVQQQAKVEKRGVWAIRDMKTAWEYRAAKEEAERKAAEARQQREAMGIVSKTSDPSPKFTAPVNRGINNPGALISKYDPKTRVGILETPILGVNDATGIGRKIAVNVAYDYHEDGRLGRKGIYTLHMVWVDTPRLAKTTDLVAKINDKSIGTIHGKLSKQSAGTSVVETLSFEIPRDMLEKIAGADDVGLWLGTEVLVPAAGFQMLLYNLLDASK